MAKARVIIKRRKAVRNIYKITKVMQMIATSLYQKAYKRAIGTKPYVRALNELVASAVQALQAAGKTVDHPLLRPADPRTPRKTAVLVLTSNRGLCGGYNSNILRLANATIKELEAAGESVALHVSGKKGIAYFRFQERQMAKTYTTIGDNPQFPKIEKLAEEAMAAFEQGQITGLKIVCMRFISAGVQRPGVIDILPLTGIAKAAPQPEGTQEQNGKTTLLFDFMPEPELLLKELLPTVVKISIFQAFIEATVSEQIARMVAMKSATDNAEKLIKRLTQSYNRARQTQITSELSELMGGVEALK
jgi:F-type H+-transporting ATPase subunit gamma